MKLAGRPWIRVQRQVFAEETHCCLCGEWVDQALPCRDNRARSAHHFVSPIDAPHLALERTNIGLAHIACNRRAGQGAPPIRRAPTRAWL